LYVSQPDSGEQALGRRYADSLGAIDDCVVIDSVAALAPRAPEIEGENGRVASRRYGSYDEPRLPLKLASKRWPNSNDYHFHQPDSRAS